MSPDKRTLTRTERRDRLAMAREVALHTSIAVQSSRTLTRLLERLRTSIRTEERGHQRFGASLIGHKPRRLATMPQVVDLFVACAILAGLYTDHTAGELASMREDYQIGAMIAGHPDVRPVLRKRFPKMRALEIASLLDYAAIVAGDSV